jgi:predicted AlkP superfamily pyrophosphatase or phosphodiesterase
LSIGARMKFGRMHALMIVTYVALSLAYEATFPQPTLAQTAPRVPRSPVPKLPQRPKLVVVLVVDQMRADYVEKFRSQWTAGLKRLVEEGAWFRDAAYPYADTETCVGHSTISTGAFPATHGMISNEWWDRDFDNGKDENGNPKDKGRRLPCTYDATVSDTAYGGLSTSGKDSGARIAVPTLSDELRFQLQGSRVVTFSLKARAAIALAGHRADAATWFDSKTGAWATSSAYGSMPFVEDFARAHPVKEDYGKTWALQLPASNYLYDDRAYGSVPPDGWGPELPHSLSGSMGKDGSTGPDPAFYQQWSTSPFSDAYLERLAEASVDSLGLGQGGGTDFLGVALSALDYVGHAYGPRSHEVQDLLIRLDATIGKLLAHLDRKVGPGKYNVALTGDHGVAPIPEDIQRSGLDAGWVSAPEVQSQIENALAAFHYPEHPVASVGGSNIYLAPGVFDRLLSDRPAIDAVKKAVLGASGVESVFLSTEVQNRPATMSPSLRALAAGYFPGRSGDILITPKPYWEFSYWGKGEKKTTGTVHGGPYYYDQHVPILLMGLGIQPGEYRGEVTPADIAPTLASLCGVTLSTRDGRPLIQALSQALSKPEASYPTPRAPASTAPAKP